MDIYNINNKNTNTHVYIDRYTSDWVQWTSSKRATGKEREEGKTKTIFSVNFVKPFNAQPWPSPHKFMRKSFKVKILTFWAA